MDTVTISVDEYKAFCRDRDLLDQLDRFVREHSSPHSRHLVLHEDWEDGVWWAIKDCSWPSTCAVEDRGPHRNVRTAIRAAVKSASLL